MAVRTKGPSRTAYRSRRPTRGVSRSPSRNGLQAPRPTRIWLLVGLVAVVGISSPWTVPWLINGFEALLTLCGLGLALLISVLAIDIWVAAKRVFALTRRFWRITSGLHMLIITIFAMLALIRPGWTVGDVVFAESSLGGEFGYLFVSSAIGLLALSTVTLGGASLIWPSGARRGVVALATGSRYVGDELRGFFAPQVDDELDEPTDSPYVAQLDEDFAAAVVAEKGLEVVEENPVAPEQVVETEEDEEGIVPLVPESLRTKKEVLVGRPAGSGWELPPLELLSSNTESKRQVDNEARAQLIIDTLKSFGVDARVVSINQGPTVTQFGVEPGWEMKTRTIIERDSDGRPIKDSKGNPKYRTEVTSRTRIRVNKITSLANDISLALASPSIRIEAPVPGKPVIGIELPNTVTSLVTLRSILESASFRRISSRSRLAISLGKGVSGEPISADLAKMPHLLIAGATGSGKSVAVNSIISCLLMQNTPEEVRLVLVDPKRVELTPFANIPHLAFSHVITDMDEVVGTLQAVIYEMESRYRKFTKVEVRNIDGYNKSPHVELKLPHWVVVIDELADLMMIASYEVERQICRLAQLARATGIHLIIATQRPSVDVVTGLIKANFPTRMAFAVSSQVDSRTILDGAGAEKLLGKGDMLFQATDAAKPKRLQGSFVSDQETDRIVEWWKSDRFRHLMPGHMDHLVQEAAGADGKGEGSTNSSGDDPLLEAARELALQHSRISTSLLQRRLRVGYPRAARLIDILEEQGVVSEADGSGQSRRVLASEDEEGMAGLTD